MVSVSRRPVRFWFTHDGDSVVVDVGFLVELLLCIMWLDNEREYADRRRRGRRSRRGRQGCFGGAYLARCVHGEGCIAFC